MPTEFYKKIIPGEKIIFIVDDDDVYSKALKAFIQHRFPDMKDVKSFSTGELCLLEMHMNPGIVIMDYFLNSKNEDANSGLEIIKRIKTHRPQTNIIMLSIQKNSNVILDAIKKYNCIYVPKDSESFNKIEMIIKNIYYSENTLHEPWN
jgi:DNA-binding NarL/FixJ family response regulator